MSDFRISAFVEGCDRDRASTLLRGWIALVVDGVQRPIKRMRIVLSDGSEHHFAGLMARSDVASHLGLHDARVAYRVSFPLRLTVGMIKRIVVLFGDDESEQELEVSPAEFFTNGFMWLHQRPVVKSKSLHHDIGSYSTRINQGELTKYTENLVGVLDRTDHDVSEFCVGQILSTALYRAVESKDPEKIAVLDRVYERYINAAPIKDLRWGISARTARFHLKSSLSDAKGAVAELEVIAKTRGKLKQDFYTYYNFVHTQTIHSAIHLWMGNQERSLAIAKSVIDAAYEGIVLLPRAYAMMKETRDIMQCVMHAEIIRNYTTAKDPSKIPFKHEPLDLLKSCSRVKSDEFVQNCAETFNLRRFIEAG